MFDIVKSSIDLVKVIEADTGLIFKESGQNYVIEDDEDTDGCPSCGHHGCFRIKHDPAALGESFYKCFSCGVSGDVISWTASRHNISAKDAALRLAKEYNLQLPHDYSPIQEVFNLAGRYYQTCLLETCNAQYRELGNLTPLEYQQQVRRHSEEVIKEFGIGWSDGGLIEYLLGLGFDEDLLKSTGLTSKDGKKDFLPARTFIYPHKVKGRVSHFTFKDPSKRLAYQLPKKFSLNGWLFYNQDSVSESDTVILVEGENDLLSMVDAGHAPAILGCIGQISGEQLDWIRNNLSRKNIVTIFDPDDAGDKYRVKVEQLRKYVGNLAHVLPPDGKDIDEHLCNGADVLDLVKNNLVQVKVEAKKSDGGIAVDWSKSTPEGFKQTLSENGLGVPGESAPGTASADTDEETIELENNNIVQKRGAYYRISFKEGVPEYTKISDFILKLKNVYLTEDGDRHREVVVVRQNGFVSDPVLIDSETKVSLKHFRTTLARAADCDFRGREGDLIGMWELVYQQAPDVLVRVPRTVGRMDKHKGFIFRNVFISDTGVITQPDEDGIFWLHGRSIGIRPESLNQRSALDSNRTDIPFLETEVDAEQAHDLLGGVIQNLSRNLTGPGLALTALGWTKMCLYADTIFSINKGVPQLFLWGTNGKGKTTVAKWLQDFYGMRDHGSTSVPLLKSGVGWARKSEYYSCLPLMIDEVRSNDETKQYLGTFRSYYDREGRTMGTADGFGVRTTSIRSCFVFVGEDQFDDPATRERCIPIRIPANGRETVETYRWMEDNRHLFTGITYRWILEYGQTDKDALKARLRALDRKLVAAGCPQRTSKNWAAIGIFGIEMAKEYLPEFDFEKYLIEACTTESVLQKTDSTLMQFFEIIESVMSLENSPINENHVMADDQYVYIWYPHVFRIVKEGRSGFGFSKNAVLSALREEPYFVCDTQRKQMGLGGGSRPRVVTLRLEDAPEVIRNIAKVLD